MSSDATASFSGRADRRREHVDRLDNEQLHTILERSSDIVSVLSRDGTIAYESPSAERLLGYSPAERVGTNALSLIHPDDLESVRSKLDALAARAGSRQMAEYRYRHEDGSWRTLESICTNLLDDDAVRGIVVNTRDVTERRQAEEALEQRERRYRLVVEQASDGILVVDGDSNVRFANTRMCEMLGYSADEILRVNVRETYPPGELPIAAQRMAALREGSALRFERLMRRKDGSLFPVEVTVSVVEPGSYQAMVRDVTDRKAMDEALRRSEALLSETQRIGRVGSWEWNIQTNEIVWSDETFRMFGLDPRKFDATYDSFLEALHPDDRERVDREVREAMRGNFRYSPEFRVVHPDGTERVVHSDGEVVFDDSHTPLRMVGIIQDITERKLAEDALRESRERFRQLAENIDEVFWMSDIATTQMLYVSPAYESVWGRSCQSVYDDPMSFIDGIHPDDRARLIEALEDQARTGAMETEYRVLRPDGSIRWIHDRGFPIRDDRGEIYRVAGIAEDITERKRTNDELESTNARLRDALEELKAAEHRVIQQERLSALGTMASGIAHDFNNSLTAILGFSELLLQRPRLLDDRTKTLRYLRTLHTAALDASNTVARLREFYRNRHDSDSFLPLDLRGLVDEAVALTRPRWGGEAQAKGTRIDVRTELEDVPPVSGNPADLREVLTNLILNAVDSMPDGGTAVVRVRRSRAQVVIDVADTGAGMPEDVRRRCFEPFFTTKGARGTGLGLAMAYGIIQRHDGEITIDSAVGKGTTVTIRLPIAQTAPLREASVQRASAEPPTRLRCLVVDDERQVREVVSELLRASGHDVEAAADGPTALEMAERERFDLAIVDRAMPEMNGDSVAAGLKAISPSLPVIMLTGFGTMMNAAGTKPEGVDTVIGKPVTMDALDAAVAEVVRPRVAPGTSREEPV